jgi:hypothetical protein
MAHWAESGNITEQDVEDAERLLRQLAASKAVKADRKEKNP